MGLTKSPGVTFISVMKEVAAEEAEAGFDALLDAVEAGEEVAVTRDGKRIAYIRLEPSNRGSSV